MASAIRVRQQPASSPGPSSGNGAAQLPVYEVPIAPLTAEHIRKLNTLLQQYPPTGIVEGLKNAADLLSASAADINERVYDKTKRNRVRQEHRRNKRARRRQGDPSASQDSVGQDAVDSDEETKQLEVQENGELEQLRKKVDTVTPAMDAGIRKMIDHLAGVEFLKKGLQDTQKAAQDAAGQAAPPPSTQLSNAIGHTSNGDNHEGEDRDSSEVNADTQITQPASVNLSSTPAVPKLAQIFPEKLRASKDRYAALPSQTRYGGSDIYTGFRRAVWDSQYPPDQAPPMPKASTWFRDEERAPAPAPGVTHLSNARNHDAGRDEIDDEDEDDDDIEVALIHISTTCPLTLQEFKDPLTSTKCPHSFEKGAIETLLAEVRPPRDAHGGRRGRNAALPAGWKPSVICPVGGCANTLTRQDLVHDAALVRRIQRIQRARRQTDAYDDEEGDEAGGAGAAVAGRTNTSRGGRSGNDRNRMQVDEIDSGSDGGMSGDDIDEINADDENRGEVAHAVQSANKVSSSSTEAARIKRERISNHRGRRGAANTAEIEQGDDEEEDEEEEEDDDIMDEEE